MLCAKPAVSDNPVFHLRLIDNAASLCSDVSVTQLTLQVTNTLPVEVEVDDVWLELDSETYGTIVYSSGATTIAPGVQIVTVSCSVSYVLLHKADIPELYWRSCHSSRGVCRPRARWFCDFLP